MSENGPVISMTTIPSRIEYLEPCIEALVAHGLPVYIWLPRWVERLGEGFDGVPEFLRAMDVHPEIVEDMGPATKLLPALARFDTVITADDDHLYGEGWAAGLLQWAEERPDAAIGYRGRRFGKRLRYNGSRVVLRPKEPARVHLITGVYGTLYHRRLFADSIFQEWRDWLPNDDIMVCGHLWRRRVPMFVVPKRCAVRRTAGYFIDPLYAGNVKARHNNEGLRRCYPGWGKKRW